MGRSGGDPGLEVGPLGTALSLQGRHQRVRRTTPQISTERACPRRRADDSPETAGFVYSLAQEIWQSKAVATDRTVSRVPGQPARSRFLRVAGVRRATGSRLYI
jgi:hypothetical protein